MPTTVKPFALAGIARAAILHGRDDMARKPVSLDDLTRMCGYHLNIEDPALGQLPSKARLRGHLSRVAYEQFPEQLSAMEGVGRTLPLLVDHARDDTPGAIEWKALLGADLEYFIYLAVAMMVAVVQNGGSVSRSVLHMDYVAPIFGEMEPQDALNIVDRWLAARPDNLRAIAIRHEIEGLEKWSFNPIIARPLVRIGNDYVAPVPRLLLDRVSPSGLYFDGLQAWGSMFTDALGLSFQDYVQDQLKQIPGVEIFPEVPFGRPERRTVDFFVVADEVVILVEVKTSRPTVSSRTGQDDAAKDFREEVGHAVDQVSASAELVKNRDAAVEHIPGDKPLRGLVVTLEPWLLANSLLYEDLIGSAAVPVAITSSHELEGVVATLRSIHGAGRRLLDALSPNDGSPMALSEAVADLEPVPNPILSSAWDRFGFASAHGDEPE